LFALFIGWLITNIFYFVINSALDAQLTNKFESKSEAFAKLNYYQSAQKKATNFDDYEKILDETSQSKLGDINRYKALFLYGESTFDTSIGWSNYSSFFFPYMNKTTFSGGSIVAFLMGYDAEKGEYADRKFQLLSAYDAKRKSVQETTEDRKDSNENAKGFREEVQKDLSYAMEPILQSIQNSNAYKVRRYLNGFIQYLTLWLTFTGILIILLFHLYPAIKARNGLKVIYSSTSESSMQAISGQYLEGSTYTTLLPFKLFGLLRDFFGTKEQKGMDHAKMELKNNIEEIRVEQESSGGMMRYLIWVIPSIGFIGTVIGIAQALENSHTVISDGGQLQRQAAVQDITSYLGVAFDTTLIALFASILLYLLVQVTTRYEESFIAESLAKISTKLAGVEFTLATSDDQNWKVVLNVIKKQLTPEDQESPEVKQFISYCEKRLKG
jgi:biopolymer transport protein ExbB/TolQ